MVGATMNGEKCQQDGAALASHFWVWSPHAAHLDYHQDQEAVDIVATALQRTLPAAHWPHPQFET